MADTDNLGYIKHVTVGFLGRLVIRSATSAEGEFLSP